MLKGTPLNFKLLAKCGHPNLLLDRYGDICNFFFKSISYDVVYPTCFVAVIIFDVMLPIVPVGLCG